MHRQPQQLLRLQPPALLPGLKASWTASSQFYVICGICSLKGDDDSLNYLVVDPSLGDHLLERKADMPSVKNGQGEQVEHTEVEANQPQPVKRLFKADRPAVHLDNPHRNAKLSRRERAALYTPLAGVYRIGEAI